VAMSGHLHLVTGGPDRGHPAQPRLSIRIVLAEDHVAVRRNLKVLLDREDGMTVVSEAADLQTAARNVRGDRPHVLVLDLEMPGGSSLETVVRLRCLAPDTEIVVLTMEPSPIRARRALETGAAGFVLKDRANDELPQAVRTAAAGGEYVSPRVTAGLDALRGGADGNGLTPRETEILRLIALGHTSAEIGDQLKLSRRTVEGHRARIHHKLRTTTRAELVRYALDRHLIGA